MREVKQKYCCANLRSIKVGHKMSSLFKYIIYVYFSIEATLKGLEISERQVHQSWLVDVFVVRKYKCEQLYGKQGKLAAWWASLENIKVSKYIIGQQVKNTNNAKWQRMGALCYDLLVSLHRKYKIEEIDGANMQWQRAKKEAKKEELRK